MQTKLQPKEQALHSLPSTLVQTAIKQSSAMEISESELNEYISRRIISEQRGFSARFAKLERVLIDLDEDLCHIHICWDVLGHRTVATASLTITRGKDHFEIEIKDGAYGVLAVPRGLLPPMIPALQELAHACQPEIEALFKLPHIRLAKDKLVLNPKF